jgi:hypothetical protein
MVVSEDIPVDLVIPVLSSGKTILVDGSSNYVSFEEILDRLLLFAHIFNWDGEMFRRFMMPSEAFVDMYRENSFIMSDEVMSSGFGYWLLNHRRMMNAEELAEYERVVMARFHGYDVVNGARRLKVKAIQAQGRINPLLPVRSEMVRGTGRIYLLGGA